MKHMTRPCPACDGEGQVLRVSRYSDRRSRWPLQWHEPCETCKATGSLEVDVPMKPHDALAFDGFTQAEQHE